MLFLSEGAMIVATTTRTTTTPSRGAAGTEAPYVGEVSRAKEGDGDDGDDGMDDATKTRLTTKTRLSADNLRLHTAALAAAAHASRIASRAASQSQGATPTATTTRNPYRRQHRSSYKQHHERDQRDHRGHSQLHPPALTSCSATAEECGASSATATATTTATTVASSSRPSSNSHSAPASVRSSASNKKAVLQVGVALQQEQYPPFVYTTTTTTNSNVNTGEGCDADIIATTTAAPTAIRTPTPHQREPQEHQQHEESHQERPRPAMTASGPPPPPPERSFANLFVSHIPKHIDDAGLLAIFCVDRPVMAKVMVDMAVDWGGAGGGGNCGVRSGGYLPPPPPSRPRSKGIGFVVFASEQDGKRAHNRMVRLRAAGRSVLNVFPSRHGIGTLRIAMEDAPSGTSNSLINSLGLEKRWREGGSHRPPPPFPPLYAPPQLDSDASSSLCLRKAASSGTTKGHATATTASSPSEARSLKGRTGTPCLGASPWCGPSYKRPVLVARRALCAADVPFDRLQAVHPPSFNSKRIGHIQNHGDSDGSCWTSGGGGGIGDPLSSPWPAPYV